MGLRQTVGIQKRLSNNISVEVTNRNVRNHIEVHVYLYGGDFMEQDLTSIIEELIQSHREDNWWDFKREHHHDKADLVHDITCMADSRANRDAYIIFGIENQTFNVLGVENDPNRRNQQGIVDILRSVSYAGSVRPRIELRTINLEQHKVDVLIVKNTYDVPYYLERQYQDKRIKSADGKKIGKIVESLRKYVYLRQ